MELVLVHPFNPLPPLKLSPDQTAEMIKVSARPPPERRDAVIHWRKTLGYESLSKIAAWGLDISPDMVSLTGECRLCVICEALLMRESCIARVLGAPQVQYRGQGAAGITRPNGG